MHLNKTYIFLLLFIIPILVNAQRWKRSRYEMFGALSIGNYMGDIGGSAKKGRHFLSISDYDFASSRPSLFIGARYKILERLAVRLNLVNGYLFGSDALSGIENRKARNLSFRSYIFEQSFQCEFSIIKERTGRRYTFANLNSLRNLYINTYIFVGFGGFYFNPKAKYQGKWYALQPLGTEGQGIDNNPPKYHRYQLTFPVGIGFKYGLNRKLSLGIEYGFRYTTTDYLDDVSRFYYYNNKIKEAYGEIAAKLADRTQEYPGWENIIHHSGAKRGSPKYNDTYMFFVVNMVYKMKTSRRGLPKF